MFFFKEFSLEIELGRSRRKWVSIIWEQRGDSWNWSEACTYEAGPVAWRWMSFHQWPWSFLAESRKANESTEKNRNEKEWFDESNCDFFFPSIVGCSSILLFLPFYRDCFAGLQETNHAGEYVWLKQHPNALGHLAPEPWRGQLCTLSVWMSHYYIFLCVCALMSELVLLKNGPLTYLASRTCRHLRMILLVWTSPYNLPNHCFNILSHWIKFETKTILSVS